MGNLKQRFGSLVAAHRKRVGWTQRQLAEAAELSDDMVARVEMGRTGVSFDTIEKLANALHVDPAEFFTTELAQGAFKGTQHGKLIGRLAALRPEEVAWLERIVEAILSPKK